MQLKRLGNSGLLTTDLALGTMIFGEETERSTPLDVAEHLIHAYLDAGGNHIDTANIYGEGRSEEVVGKAIKGRRDHVIIATKVNFPVGDEGPGNYGLSRQHVMQAVEDSLRRLNTGYIDIYYMHGWDINTPIQESLRAFDDLVRQGKVRYIGVSNFKAWQVMKSLSISDTQGLERFVVGQYQYSLVNRDIEYEFTDLLACEGVGLTAWGPLGGGFLTGKYKRGERPTEGRIAMMPEYSEEFWPRRDIDRNWDIIDAVGAIAEERDVSYAQVAVAWVRAQPHVASVVIGVRTMEQLADNLRSADLDLSDDEIAMLNQASTMPDLYPYRFAEIYSHERVD